jgi:hypothetical protein
MWIFNFTPPGRLGTAMLSLKTILCEVLGTFRIPQRSRKETANLHLDRSPQLFRFTSTEKWTYKRVFYNHAYPLALVLIERVTVQSSQHVTINSLKYCIKFHHIHTRFEWKLYIWNVEKPTVTIRSNLFYIIKPYIPPTQYTSDFLLILRINRTSFPIRQPRYSSRYSDVATGCKSLGIVVRFCAQAKYFITSPKHPDQVWCRHSLPWNWNRKSFPKDILQHLN